MQANQPGTHATPTPYPAEACALSRTTVLLVDDEMPSRNAVKRILRRQAMDIVEAGDGQQALGLLASQPVDLILLDIRMPTMDGFAFLERFRSKDTRHSIPVCVLSGLADDTDRRRAYDLGADDFVAKTVDNVEFTGHVRSLLDTRKHYYSSHNIAAELERIAKGLSHKLDTPPAAFIEVWREIGLAHTEIANFAALAAQLKNGVSQTHIYRVSRYSALLAKRAGWSASYAALLSQAARLHDLGKICIPDSILHKDEALTRDELEVAKQYPRIGAALLSDTDSKLMHVAREIALTHREHYDGSGFPYRLEGKNIPAAGRIVAIADVFDALLGQMHSQDSEALGDAVRTMRELAGHALDPQLVELFLRNPGELLEIQQHYPSNDRRTPLCYHFV